MMDDSSGDQLRIATDFCNCTEQSDRLSRRTVLIHARGRDACCKVFRCFKLNFDAKSAARD